MNLMQQKMYNFPDTRADKTGFNVERIYMRKFTHPLRSHNLTAWKDGRLCLIAHQDFRSRPGVEFVYVETALNCSLFGLVGKNCVVITHARRKSCAVIQQSRLFCTKPQICLVCHLGCRCKWQKEKQHVNGRWWELVCLGFVLVESRAYFVIVTQKKMKIVRLW